MQIKAIETFLVTMPFRFAVGHSRASRKHSNNVIVRVTLSDGTQGYGEGVPRDYVTGETAETARFYIENVFAARLIGSDVTDPLQVFATLEQTFTECGLENSPKGAAWCAVELAIIDAVSKAHEHRVADWFGPPQIDRIRYGGVIPFGSRTAVKVLATLYKLFGFNTVKVKVGKKLKLDIANVAATRRIMGENCTIRVDANCAWRNYDEAMRAIEALRPYNVVSYEQPLAADAYEDLSKITAAVPEQIVADESLCTIDQAKYLADQKIVSAFNIRLSKVGGLLAARKIQTIAQKHGLACHLGAQVGESGILSAAARVFALTRGPFDNHEGSMNMILLADDLTAENLTVKAGGFADLTYSKRQPHGFGFSISEGTLESWAQRYHCHELAPDEGPSIEFVNESNLRSAEAILCLAEKQS